MYKVYINDIAVFLLDKAKWQQAQSEYANDESAEFYLEQEDWDIEQKIERWENERSEKTVLIIGSDLERLKERFFSHYKIVRAGGGAVLNKDGALLVIFRKGKWDLPKGKQESETIEACAIREVEEETGVKGLNIDHPITFPGLRNSCMMHTYIDEGQRILKETYWFKMQSEDPGDLHPQTAEDIREVKWVKPSGLEKCMENTYRSLLDIFELYK